MLPTWSGESWVNTYGCGSLYSFRAWFTSRFTCGCEGTSFPTLPQSGIGVSSAQKTLIHVGKEGVASLSSCWCELPSDVFQLERESCSWCFLQIPPGILYHHHAIKRRPLDIVRESGESPCGQHAFSRHFRCWINIRAQWLLQRCIAVNHKTRVWPIWPIDVCLSSTIVAQRSFQFPWCWAPPQPRNRKVSCQCLWWLQRPSLVDSDDIRGGWGFAFSITRPL